MALRWLHVVVLPSWDHWSASCFLRFVFVRQKCPMPQMITCTRGKTKMTRLNKIPSWWSYEWQDGQTKMNLRMAWSSCNVLACQILWKNSRTSCRNGKTQQVVVRWYKIAQDALTTCPMLCDQIRFWTFNLSCVHLVSISNSGQCDVCIRVSKIFDMPNNCRKTMRRSIFVLNSCVHLALRRAIVRVVRKVRLM